MATIPTWWTKARSLAQRANDGPPDAAAKRRRESWERSLPDGLLEHAARELLEIPASLDAALSDAPLPDAEIPAWSSAVQRTLATAPADGPRADDATPVIAAGRRIASAFVAAARRDLEAHPHARDDAVQLLAANLGDGLVGLFHRPLALEFEVARLIEGWPPDEADARAWAVTEEFADRDRARAFLEENPCIARMAADRLRLAVDACGRVLDHLASDLPTVDEAIAPEIADATIVSIDAMGDRHDGCRQVLKIGFSTGGVVMYKPRSLATDIAYDGLLAALVARGFEPAFRPLPTLALGPDRGWQAFAVATGCDDADAVTRYFERLGGQLAVLYALRATDMHFENVVAAGEHPVIIDLETLLQPRLGARAADTYDPLLGESGVQSVLRVGILPRPDGPMGLDMSGIGRDPDAAQGVSEQSWAAWAMGPERARERLELGENVARLDGEPVRPQEHVGAVAAGFERAYRLLFDHRDELLAPGGALTAFRECDLRVLLRPTQTYAFVKRQLAGKDACLADGLAQEEVLHVLWRSARGRPDLEAVTVAERHDLWMGDVPRIGARPASSDLYHHVRGRIEGALGDQPCPGPDVVMRLGEDDLERQLSFVRTSIRASAAHPVAEGAREPRPHPAPFVEATPQVLVQTAASAARRLARLALHDGEQATWLCLVNRCAPRDGAVLASAWLDLADGQAGLAWFLGDLARTTGGGAAGELAAAAGARLGTQLRAPAGIEPEHRGGVLFALAGLDLGAGAPAEGLLSDEIELTGPALAAWVLALAAVPRRHALGARARERLPHDAGRLADAPGGAVIAPALAARALALASAALDSPRLGVAALEVLEAGRDVAGDDPALGLLAWVALARSPAGVASHAHDGLRRLLPSLPAAGCRDRPTLDGLLDALAVHAAADVLGDPDLRRHGRDLAGEALAGLRADGRPVYHRDLETPGLRDGLAGVGAALLALSRPQRAASESALLLSRTMPRRIERIGPSHPSGAHTAAAEVAA